MTLYKTLGDGIGSIEARDLAARLVAWHDAMVTHLRRLTHTGAVCTDGCPHDEARALWTEARARFGDQAAKLAFLKTCGAGAGARPAARRFARTA
jgi:hypothetical protein